MFIPQVVAGSFLIAKKNTNFLLWLLSVISGPPIDTVDITVVVVVLNMDQAITTSDPNLDGSPPRAVGTLHRGALQEINIDRLLNRPSQSQHEKLSASLSDLSHASACVVQSEPRPRRRRCASGDECSPAKLFDDIPTFEERVFFMNATEALTLKANLRQRRISFHDRHKDEISRSQHELLMRSIRQRRKGSVSNTNSLPRRAPRSRFVIPMDHPFKTIWDIMTVILSIANAHAIHVSIRERKFGLNTFMMFCNLWFMVDILLNFCTERKTADGEILRDYRSICARYLTSWFAIDILALMPWELLYVKPIIELQNKRRFFQKYFFRSKAVVRVTRHLRGKHFRWFGTVAKHTKQHGVGASRLLRLIIKYVPKYLLFLRNMKGGVAVRVLRQFQWFRRFYHNIVLADTEKSDSMTGSLTYDDFDDDLSSKQHEKNQRVKVVYESWELVDDEDDGVPL